MEQCQRFAVYFTPPPSSPLAEFGAAWLGWDVDTGRVRAHPTLPGLPKPIEALTETPRKYGFHATLKPPMQLTPHASPDALVAELERLSEELAPVRLEGLHVSTLGKFVALTPVGDVRALNALASRVVKALDHLRAPPSAAELARRRAGGLTAGQDAMLLKWGYPYVLDEFRFHMTLSGQLEAAEAETLRHMLAPKLAQIVPGRIAIDALTLVGEAADGRFHTLQRHPLTGA